MRQLSAENQQRFNLKTESGIRRFLRSSWRWCCKVALVQPSMLSYLEPLIRLLRPGFRAYASQARLITVQQTGPFLRLTLKPGRRWQGFIPGQHVQLMLENNGRTIARTFSISSALQLYQQQGLIQLTVQLHENGQLTPKLAGYLPDTAVAVGGKMPDMLQRPVVHLSEASGDFVPQPQLQPILMLAAGSGITPIHGMLCSMTRLTQPLLLIYSYRGAEQLLFAESWLDLQQRFPLLQVQLIDTTCRQRLQPDELSVWLTEKPDSLIYVCGPTAFSQQWLQHFARLNISPAQIRHESFGLATTGPSQAAAQAQYPITVRQGAQQQVVASRLGSLLENLEAAGLQPTYGCRRGICMQCLCQKQQGLVRNLLTGDISDAGAGQIQLCISEPLSAVALTLA